MRAVATVRIVLGGLLVLRPSVGARSTGTPATPGVVTLTRVLGLRYLAQGGLDLLVPHDRRLDAGVEALHAASMLPVAWVARRHARPALLSAGIAVALAVADGAGGAA